MTLRTSGVDSTTLWDEEKSIKLRDGNQRWEIAKGSHVSYRQIQE